MAKKIKKQFWKTIPYFMIFSLVLSSVIGGVVFNFDFEIEKVSKNNYSIEVNKPIVQAQDLASTTVTVKNAAPVFNGYPVETDISTSSSPINVGGDIGFQATGDDPEGNSYYLIICSTDAVTASTTGGAPVCDVDTFCTSGVTVDNTPASCTYTGITDPGSETDEWYAFICDNHGSEAECIDTSSQGENPGVAASSSPFYVNHAPHITTVGTSINNQDPGGTFEFTATSTDSDVADVDDILTMHVCTTNAWTLGVGCDVGTFCTATATDVISCEWTDAAPTPDADYDYWVFVSDHHTMAADNNSQTSNYTINNVAPVVNGVYLVPNDATNISLNLRGAAAVNIYASSTNVVDQNGCLDLVGATSTVYWENVTGSYGCAADDTDCYEIGAVSCTITDCGGAGDAKATITCDTDLEFIARPTGPSSDVSGTTWFAALHVYDNNGATTTGVTPSGTNVLTNTALDVTQDTIAYGSLKSNENSGTSTASTTIENYGNSPLNVDISGTDMVKGGDSIPIENQEYSLTENFNYGAGTSASSTATEVDLITTVRPTTLAGNNDYLYWGIAIPAVPSGEYKGDNTFAVNLDETGW